MVWLGQCVLEMSGLYSSHGTSRSKLYLIPFLIYQYYIILRIQFLSTVIPPVILAYSVLFVLPTVMSDALSGDMPIELHFEAPTLAPAPCASTWQGETCLDDRSLTSGFNI